jgi:hypothetical protein
MTGSNEKREKWEPCVTGWIAGALATPFGALVYIEGGWGAVALLSVLSFLCAIVTIGWLAWDEVRR